MTILSGWCSGPPNARLQCAHCRFDLCEHECHQGDESPGQSVSRGRGSGTENGRVGTAALTANKAVPATAAKPSRDLTPLHYDESEVTSV